MSRLIVALCLIGGLGACTAQTDSSCGPGSGSPVAVFTLFFGKAISERDDLTEKEWQIFLATTVTANLPDGYTSLDAIGGWLDPVTHKTIKEGAKVLLVALPEVPASLAAIDRVRTAYRIKFQQQLVGMTVQHACGEF